MHNVRERRRRRQTTDATLKEAKHSCLFSSFLRKPGQLPGILVEDETRHLVPQPLFCLVTFFQAVWFVNIPYNIDSNDSVHFLHHIWYEIEDLLDIILKGTAGSRNQKVNYSRSIDDFTINIQESTMTIFHISFEAVQKVMLFILANLTSRQLAMFSFFTCKWGLVIRIVILTT